jgi:hypothetical protein
MPEDDIVRGLEQVSNHVLELIDKSVGEFEKLKTTERKLISTVAKDAYFKVLELEQIIKALEDDKERRFIVGMLLLLRAYFASKI